MSNFSQISSTSSQISGTPSPPRLMSTLLPRLPWLAGSTTMPTASSSPTTKCLIQSRRKSKTTTIQLLNVNNLLHGRTIRSRRRTLLSLSLAPKFHLLSCVPLIYLLLPRKWVSLSSPRSLLTRTPLPPIVLTSKTSVQPST